MNIEHFVTFIIGITFGYISGVITDSPIQTVIGLGIGAIIVFIFLVKKDE